MTNEERFKKYIEEHCKNCINKRSDLCDIMKEKLKKSKRRK